MLSKECLLEPNFLDSDSKASHSTSKRADSSSKSSASSDMVHAMGEAEKPKSVDMGAGKTKVRVFVVQVFTNNFDVYKLKTTSAMFVQFQQTSKIEAFRHVLHPIRL